MTLIPSYYQGYTYPAVLDNRLAHWLWKRLCCPRHWHLWDEVWSGFDHVMYCDACGVEFGWREGSLEGGNDASESELWA